MPLACKKNIIIVTLSFQENRKVDLIIKKKDVVKFEFPAQSWTALSQTSHSDSAWHVEKEIRNDN